MAMFFPSIPNRFGMASHLFITPTFAIFKRAISTTSVLRLKEIREIQKGNKTIVEGVKVPSPREGKIAIAPPEAKADACPLCRLGLKRLNFSDVLILSQFLKPNGEIMTIGESQLCGRKYHMVKKCIIDAQRCRLLPRPVDYEIYGPWDALNTYIERPSRRRDQTMRQVQPFYWSKVDFREGELPPGTTRQGWTCKP